MALAAASEPGEWQQQGRQLIGQIRRQLFSGDVMQKAAQYDSEGRFEESFEIYLAQTQQENVQAMNALSVCYELGVGVEENAQKAFFGLKQAAENGLSYAYYPLAYRYYISDGTKPNREKAIYWAQKAACLENASTQDACTLLEKLQQTTEDNLWMTYAAKCEEQPEKQTEAFQIYQKLAQAKNPEAMYCLSYWYQEGCGTEQNPIEAMRWLNCAAENGEQLAYYPLAWLYANADAAQQDLQKALYWAEKAACVEGENKKMPVRF